MQVMKQFGKLYSCSDVIEQMRKPWVRGQQWRRKSGDIVEEFVMLTMFAAGGISILREKMISKMVKWIVVFFMSKTEELL